MVKLDDLYAFIEGNFEYLLAANANEGIIHASRLLGRACGPGEIRLAGLRLEQALSPDSLKSFRSGISLARGGSRGTVVYTPRDRPDTAIPLRTGYVEAEGIPVYLFFGAMVDGLSQVGETEKDERIKELFCIYTTAEWIEVSRSIQEFFSRLPDYLRRGMQYPELVVVHSTYQGLEHGQTPPGKYLSAKLVLNQQDAGEIRVGYIDDEHDLMPEEQRMLSEIARMLSLALERKLLSERLTLKQEEERDTLRHLRELEEEIAARSREIEEQRQKLGTVNSYLDRVNRGWEESRQWLETVLKGIPDQVALIDRQRNLVMTNHGEFRSGDKCHRTIFGRDVPCQDCRLARIIRDKSPITLTIEHEEKLFEVHALPIFSPDHEVDGIMEFYRDVTLEKTYERQIQQADKLASLGQLVSGIGHEINNPNQFIRGNIKILKQALDDMLPIVDEYQRAHPELKIARLQYDFFRQHVMTLVDDMSHGSERIKGIVEGLRRFARRDEGLLIDTVDVNTVIEAATRLVQNEVGKHAEIRLELQPDLPAFTGNSQKIEQVLINLIVNASQAMPDDRKGTIDVRSWAEDGSVVVEVRDSGKGMSEKTIKQIFDPFFTTKRASGGTGLGLPIAYRIVEEHGGTIAVTSQLGIGSTFQVRFPVRRIAVPEKR
jgi:signal transduction histidine kinase